MADRQYLVTFAVMLLTALIISALTQRVRLQAESSRSREQRTASLLNLSRDLSVARSIDEVVAATAKHVSELLGSNAEMLLANPQGKLAPPPGSELAAVEAKELSVAQWTFDRGEIAGRGTATLPAAAGTYFPLKAPRGVIGVLALKLDSSQLFAGEQKQLVEAFASQAALALERAFLAEETRLAWERVEAEFLRNTLLSAVSHDLRTPLAGIIGAASTLAHGGQTLPSDDQNEMLATIQSEAERMDRIITNLLAMTRMESGGLTLRREPMAVSELVGAALVHLRRRLDGRPVRTVLPGDLPMVDVDPLAIEQALVNLLDNAVEHTPAKTELEISGRAGGPSVVLEISDRGPGLPPGTEKRVFEKFFRASASPHRGIGLGLAIVRSIVEAHGGTASASNRAGGGASFQITTSASRSRSRESHWPSSCRAI